MKDADDLLLAGRLTDAVGRQRRLELVCPTRKGSCFSGLALRDCLKQRRATIDDLWKAAKVCRVANVMRPYLESLA